MILKASPVFSSTTRCPELAIPLSIGQPEIECNDGNVRIAIKTSNGVASRIFAKGHYTNNGCTFERTNSATFGIGACGMNRQRQVRAWKMHVWAFEHLSLIARASRYHLWRRGRRPAASIVRNQSRPSLQCQMLLYGK